jgi:hypothetical protein
MHPIFQITSSQIQALNDEQARELVAHLCKEELRTKGLGTDPVTWGGDQRAKDGGVDVRVDIAPAFGISGYIPKDATAFQVKAEKYGSKKIPGEMAPKGVLRPAIVEFSEQSGAYIIVSTRDTLSDSSLRARKKAMSDCLEERGLAGKVRLDFYDSRKIADWTGNFPGVVVWLRSLLGIPLNGWRPYYSPWAYREKSVEDEYLLDDKVKIFIPNADEGIEVTTAINRLREELSKDGTSVRIVGLSGVGKTRLAQALFDNRIVTLNAALNQENVLYTDLSDNPTPQPIAMLEALLLEKSDSVVVIDNCGQDVHQKLTEIVKRPDSKIRLVTVEYDIRDDLPQDTACYRLEGSSDEVIAKLLKRQYHTLSDLDIAKIVKFSDGNARVAFALASTSQMKGELARLTDDALFQRLFVQKHSTSVELQKCAEVASLLYSFDVEDISEKSELALLSSIAEVTIKTFYRNVSDLEERGLVQKRGKWRAVLPHAISNRLALKAIQASLPSLLVQKLVAEASERVARSFSRRLGYLHESKHAQQIVGDWLKPDGLLGDIAQLNEFRCQMLENVAPINQRAALDVLLRAVEKKEFISVSNPSRARFAHLLRSLAYEPDLFDDAVSALLKFALEEPEDYKSDSIRDVLQSLFYSHLSGTLASPEQRAAFVKAQAFSGDKSKQKLALTLLQASLETYHFSSFYGFDFGALRRGYGWQPKTHEEIQQWYGVFIGITVELGKIPTAFGADARSLLGANFRGLWTNAGIYEALTNAARDLTAIDGWPDGWIGIRNTLHWDNEQLKGLSLEQLKALEKELAPRDLLTKIRAKVLSRGTFGADLEDEDGLEESNPGSTVDWYYKSQQEAEILGKAAALDEKTLADLGPYIFNSRSTDKSFFFGIGVGQVFASVQGLLDRIRELIAQASESTVDLQFAVGLIKGWNKTKPEEASAFLDKAVEDEVWGAHFPRLQLSFELDEVGFRRLIKSLKFGQAPCWKYKFLGYGRKTDPLSVEQISTLLDMLAAKPDGGLTAAIDVLYMVIHCTDKKSDEYRGELRIYCIRFVSELDWASIDLTNGNFVNHLKQIIEFALSGSDQHEAATKALTRLIQQEQTGKQIYPPRLGDIFLPFFKNCPSEALEAVYDKEKHTALMRMLTIQLDKNGETALGVIPEATLIDWCKNSPDDRCIFAAQTCTLFERPNQDGLKEEKVLGISRTAQGILALAPDKKKVLEIFLSRFTPSVWSGSRAAIMRQGLQLLDQLNPTDDLELAAQIEDTKTRFSREIAAEEQWEQEKERSKTGSFEY